jgi:hypothetical protein
MASRDALALYGPSVLLKKRSFMSENGDEKVRALSLFTILFDFYMGLRLVDFFAFWSFVAHLFIFHLRWLFCSCGEGV